MEGLQVPVHYVAALTRAQADRATPIVIASTTGSSNDCSLKNRIVVQGNYTAESQLNEFDVEVIIITVVFTGSNIS